MNTIIKVALKYADSVTPEKAGIQRHDRTCRIARMSLFKGHANSFAIDRRDHQCFSHDDAPFFAWNSGLESYSVSLFHAMDSGSRGFGAVLSSSSNSLAGLTRRRSARDANPQPAEVSRGRCGGRFASTGSWSAPCLHRIYDSLRGTGLQQRSRTEAGSAPMGSFLRFMGRWSPRRSRRRCAARG